jgi:hypothetical protein
LIFCDEIFFEKISWLSGVVGWLVVVLPFLWLVSTVLLILIRLNCGWWWGSAWLAFQRKLFSVSVFSLIFILWLAIFS